MKEITQLKDGNFYTIINNNILRIIPKNLDKIIPEEELWKQGIITAPKGVDIYLFLDKLEICEKENGFKVKAKLIKKAKQLIQKAYNIK